MLAEATAHDYETHCRARARCRHPSGEFVPFAREEIEQSIPARFSKIVARYPDRPAIQEGERTLTYTELNQAANCVAHRLLELCGPQPEPIATLFDHGTDAIVALLGVLKAGKFYAPLHPPDPAARHRSIVESAGAPIILTDAQNATAARKVAGQGRQVIEVDARISEPALPDPAIAIAPDRCAYLLYTSGSTGEPKGVVMDQRSTLHATMSYTNSCGMCAADRTALVSYLSFSGHVQPVFTALLNGGAVLPFDVPREGVRKLAAWLAEEEITVFIGVAVFRHMAQTFAPGDTFPHLRLIYHGGGPAFRSDLELYRRHFCDDCIFVNSFATTETKAIRRIFLDKQIELAGEVVPVGYAVDDVDIAVWNEAGQPVAEGEAGEIVAHTPFLASGYWQNEELTQARFVPDPHHPGQRAYRTGDLGKLLPDGCLLHLGRIDHQVKIRGHRVELTEVEGLLGRQPGVREAAVHPFQNRHGDQALAAYVAPDRPGMNAETLRAALNGRLPDYMTPARYIFLESLPRMTASGKVDRNALPQPERVRPSLAQAYAGPITPLESRLADIWAEVLDLDRVGVEDRFTDLGGDSLAAARLLAALDELTGRDLPFSVLLEAGTVRDLARVLEDSAWAPRWQSLVTVQAGPSWSSEDRLLWYPSNRWMYLRYRLQEKGAGRVVRHAVRRRYVKAQRRWRRYEVSGAVLAAHRAARRHFRGQPVKARIVAYLTELLADAELRRRWAELAGGGCEIVPLPESVHSEALRTDNSLRVISQHLQQELARVCSAPSP